VKQNSECEITTPNNPISSIQLTEEEKTEMGDLGLRPYQDFFSVSRGWYLLALVILCQCIFVTLQCTASYWLAIAVQSGQCATGVAIGVYAGMSTFSCLFAYIRSLVAANLGLKASREFFKGFMNSVFGAPMLFFDSTPSGRIMTRVTLLFFFVFVYQGFWFCNHYSCHFYFPKLTNFRHHLI
jgi:ATP-binding cassette, subfamily C (CFTR/MRP), member 1